MSLSRRGYRVMLAEAGTELGGRVRREARLTGLSEWIRVCDYRVGQLERASNVEIFLDNRLSEEVVLGMGVEHVIVATGSSWRRDGVGRGQYLPVPGAGGARCFTPDDIMAGVVPPGPVVVYDSDHYYMGGVMAEQLRRMGLEVSLVTPAPMVSQWSVNTMEQDRVQARLLSLGVTLMLSHGLAAITEDAVDLHCAYTGTPRSLPAESVVLVTARTPADELYHSLLACENEFSRQGLKSVHCIGDAVAPGTIAAAVYSGHRMARELEEAPPDGIPFRMEQRPITRTAS